MNQPVLKLLTMALLLLPVSLKAQLDLSLSAANIPDSLVKEANEVVREDRTMVSIKSEKESYIKYRRVVTVLNKTAHGNHLIVYYDKDSKVAKIEANIYDAMGQFVRKVEKSEIKDYSAVSDFSIYEDNRVKYLEVVYPNYPYTVEIEYEQTLKGINHCVYPALYLQSFHSGVQQFYFAIDMPAGQALHWRALNIELQPKKQTIDGRDVYIWEAGNLKPVAREVMSPATSTILPMLLTTPDKFQLNEYSGSMSSWKDYGAFVNELFKGRDLISAELKSVIHQLTDNLNDPRQKIDTLYRYMQQNMRYVSVQLGIGGWQPFDAQYVWNNKYGDCKALSNFMKAMLNEIGIKAYPALIYGGENVEVEILPDFARPFFNHVILYIPDQQYWLECTSKTSPPNYLSSFTANRNVLLVTEEGGKIARTPSFSTQNNGASQYTRISLEDTGAAQISIKNTYKGSYSDLPRYFAINNNTNDFREWVADYSKMPSFELKTWAAKQSSRSSECQISMDAHSFRYASKAGKRLFVPTCPLQAEHPGVPEDVKRKHPFVIRESYALLDTVELAIPQGFRIENIPSEKIDLSSSFGEFHLQVVKEESRLLVLRSLVVNASTLPADQYGVYRDFFKDVAKWENMKIVLVAIE